MIVGVSANHETFNSIEFTTGFNVVLAERTDESTDKDTRNGLGKTTLLNIVHFCLGSTANPRQGLRVKQLEDWDFHLDFRMRNRLVSVSRSVNKPGQVRIAGETDWSGWPTQPVIDHREEEFRCKSAEWNSLLGWGLYDLDVDKEKIFALV